MQWTKTSLPWIALSIALILLLGCTWQKRRVKPIPVTLMASPALNLDAQGHPMPLELRLYGLSERESFEHATFFELYDHGDTALAGTVLSRQTLVLSPGETRQATLTLPPGTRAIGVMAAYQKIEQAKWRSIVDASSEYTRTLSVNIQAQEVLAHAVNGKPSWHGTFWTKLKHPWSALLPRSLPKLPTTPQLPHKPNISDRSALPDPFVLPADAGQANKLNLPNRHDLPDQLQ